MIRKPLFRFRVIDIRVMTVKTDAGLNLKLSLSKTAARLCVEKEPVIIVKLTFKEIGPICIDDLCRIRCHIIENRRRRPGSVANDRDAPRADDIISSVITFKAQHVIKRRSRLAVKVPEHNSVQHTVAADEAATVC